MRTTRNRLPWKRARRALRATLQSRNCMDTVKEAAVQTVESEATKIETEIVPSVIAEAVDGAIARTEIIKNSETSKIINSRKMKQPIRNRMLTIQKMIAKT